MCHSLISLRPPKAQARLLCPKSSWFQPKFVNLTCKKTPFNTSLCARSQWNAMSSCPFMAVVQIGALGQRHLNWSHAALVVNIDKCWWAQCQEQYHARCQKSLYKSFCHVLPELWCLHQSNSPFVYERATSTCWACAFQKNLGKPNNYRHASWGLDFIWGQLSSLLLCCK